MDAKHGDVSGLRTEQRAPEVRCVVRSPVLRSRPIGTAEDEVAEAVFQQAFIPKRLDEVRARPGAPCPPPPRLGGSASGLPVTRAAAGKEPFPTSWDTLALHAFGDGPRGD